MSTITKEISDKIKDLYLNHHSISDIISETFITRDKITRHLKESPMTPIKEGSKLGR